MSSDQDRARWEGAMEARMAAVEHAQAELAESVNRIVAALEGVKAKVGVWSALGGVLGAGLVSAVVAALLH